MSEVQPFRTRAVAAIVIVGLAAFAALLLLFAFGGNIGEPRSGRAHALSASATGYKGLVQLVGAFQPVRMVRDDSDRFGESLLVVALEAQTPPGRVQSLLATRRGRATLIILPKWITVPDPRRRGWVRGVFPGAAGMAGQALDAQVQAAAPRPAPPAVALGEDILAGIELPVPRRPQIVAGKLLTPLVRLGEAGALVARLGDQPHYVLADPDLLNNHGLRSPANALAALALIERLNPIGASSVDFDLTLNGLGRGANRSMLSLAFEPPFLAMTLALIVAALLAGLQGAVRFGPAARAKRAIAFGKAALVENSAGLIRLARREARLGAAFADVVRNDVARATGAPSGLQGEALDAYLDRMNRTRTFTGLAADLAAARDRHALLAAARALAAWRREVVGAGHAGRPTRPLATS